MIISAIVRSGAFLLFTNHGSLGHRVEILKSRYFKPFSGIVLREAMKRNCIKFDVLIDPCVGSGHFIAYAVDVITICFNSRRQHLDLFPRTGILRRQGRMHRKVKRMKRI